MDIPYCPRDRCLTCLYRTSRAYPVHCTVFSIACVIFSITRAIVKTTMEPTSIRNLKRYIKRAQQCSVPSGRAIALPLFFHHVVNTVPRLKILGYLPFPQILSVLSDNICTRAIYRVPGQYIPYCPRAAIYSILPCSWGSMEYIVLAVPLIRPRGGIQSNYRKRGFISINILFGYLSCHVASRGTQKGH